MGDESACGFTVAWRSKTGKFMSELSGNGVPAVAVDALSISAQSAKDAVARAHGKHQATPRLSGRSLTLGLAATMPIVLVGSMAMTMLTPGVAPAHKRTHSSDPATAEIDTADIVTDSSTPADVTTAADIEVASVVVPSTYTVRAGDSVSDIAQRYGLSTASVLALNGLSWSSLIFPKQVLRLTRAATATAATTHPVTAVSHSATYTIRTGDTITSIARRYGIPVQSILTANRLGASSIIYAGRTLVIPSAGTPATTHPATATGTAPASTGTATPIVSTGSSTTANARTIVSVGRSLGVPNYGLVIALAAAMQESGLQNLDFGDRDSVGLFQQLPSAGWGTVAELENPTHAAQLFFGGPKNPNRGKTRGLLDIPGWQSMSVTQAAQAVQISAAPTAYAKWEGPARALLAQLG
jgi:LysM repeat protein